MRTEQGKSERLEAVVAMLRGKVARESRAPLERFAREYYGRLDPEDIAERAPADLCGAALSHWNFAQRREPGRARLRVFNPALEEHGWQSPHTIIEIVNDDMPFLVDSVTMEVNRQGLTLHLIIHPIVAGESIMHVEVDRITEAAKREELQADLERILGDVRVAVEDWRKMTAQARSLAGRPGGPAPPPGGGGRGGGGGG